MYLVLGFVEIAIPHYNVVRGAFVFAVGAVTETLQFFGVPIFGQTFDLLDYLMFGAGVTLGMVFERIVLPGIPACSTRMCVKLGAVADAQDVGTASGTIMRESVP